MMRRPPRSTLDRSSAASDVYKRQVQNRDYVRTALAKGATPLRVGLVHVLPNAAVPIFTIVILHFSHLLAGAVIIETLFDWPGLGLSLIHISEPTRPY